MSRRFWAFFWIALIFFVQNFLGYLSAWPLGYVLVIALVFYALKEGPGFGILLGLFTGALMELFAQGGLGFYLWQMAAIGFFAGFFSSRIFPDGLLTEILLPTVFVYLYLLSENIYVHTMAGDFTGWVSLVQAFQPLVLLVTALLAPFLFSFLNKTFSRRQSSWR